MFRRLFASAIFAGLIVGIIASALQHLLVVPVIVEGERYETGEFSHFSGGAAPAAHGHAEGHDHGAAHTHDAASAGLDWRRIGLTTTATTAAFTGFALLLAVGFALAERRALPPVHAGTGVLWGLALFAAIHLAPGVGLAPELPGSIAADIGARQLWWVGTVVATLLGIGLIGLGQGWPARALGGVVIALPHLIGAPLPDVHGGVAPPELAALFASRTLAVGAVCFLLLGWLTARFWSSAQQPA